MITGIFESTGAGSLMRTMSCSFRPGSHIFSYHQRRASVSPNSVSFISPVEGIHMAGTGIIEETRTNALHGVSWRW